MQFLKDGVQTVAKYQLKTYIIKKIWRSYYYIPNRFLDYKLPRDGKSFQNVVLIFQTLFHFEPTLSGLTLRLRFRNCFRKWLNLFFGFPTGNMILPSTYICEICNKNNYNQIFMDLDIMLPFSFHTTLPILVNYYYFLL